MADRKRSGPPVSRLVNAEVLCGVARRSSLTWETVIGGRSDRPGGNLTSVGAVGIVGAGPAGLFAANVLLRAGIDCQILERLDEPAVRGRARAGLIEDRTARLLDAHG